MTILPKLRSGSDLQIGVEFVVTVPESAAADLVGQLRQLLQELGLRDTMRIEEGGLSANS